MLEGDTLSVLYSVYFTSTPGTAMIHINNIYIFAFQKKTELLWYAFFFSLDLVPKISCLKFYYALYVLLNFNIYYEIFCQLIFDDTHCVIPIRVP